jgi:hypothetical protein
MLDGMKLLVSGAAGLSPEVVAQGAAVLRRWLTDRGELAEAAARYRLELAAPPRGTYTDTVWKWRIFPREGTVEVYMTEWGGTREQTRWKAPKSGRRLESYDTIVTADSLLAYRGMAWEEWQSIRRTGFIRSRGEYNIGTAQEGLTLFTADPGQAFNYAAGFATWAFAPSFRRPGVIVTIPKSLTFGAKDDPKALLSDERAFRGAVPANLIQNVWFVVPTEMRPGDVDIHELPDGRVYSGSASFTRANSYYVLDVR